MRYRLSSIAFVKGYLLILVFIAFLGPLFTSNAPWKTRIEGSTVYPAWKIYLAKIGVQSVPQDWQIRDWKQESDGVQNLIPWDATYIDFTAINGAAPGDKGHILGADLYGKDVAAGLIEGTKVTISVAFIATGFSLLLAFLVTYFTTYMGNYRWRINIWQGLFIATGGFLGWFYVGVAMPQAGISWILRALVACTMFFLVMWLTPKIETKSNRLYGRRWAIPLDDIGLKFYEMFQSVPKLILLLVVIGMLESSGSGSSWVSLGLLMGSLVWPVFYRYLRLEVQREKSSDLFDSLRNLGFSDLRIAAFHIFPIALRSIIVPAIFVFSSAILLESTLSFLGMGLSSDYVSWGKILAQARLRMDAWWLAIFPGLMIFLTLYSLNVWSKQVR